MSHSGEGYKRLMADVVDIRGGIHRRHNKKAIRGWQSCRISKVLRGYIFQYFWLNIRIEYRGN